jgi:hypothetical protein
MMFLALLATGLACSSNPDDETFSLPPAPYARPANLTTTLGTTDALISDSTSREKIEKLHAQTLHQGVILDPKEPDGYRAGLVPTVSAKETGPDGQTGPEWLAFHDAEASVSVNDAAALLNHEDPAIRVYFAWHAATAQEGGETTNEDLANRLYPLLTDSAQVEVRFGCVGRNLTVAQAVMETLADAPNHRAVCARSEILKTVSEDERLDSAVRAIALEGLAAARCFTPEK